MLNNDPSFDAVPSAQEYELGVAAAAAAIRRGEITAESYASALLRRARDHADLNSFITIDESAVLAAASDADKARAAGSRAPLLGVPLGVKDSYLTRGLRTTLGVQTLETFVPSRDAGIVAAIRDAGGIVFGKNNLVEMSYGVTGHNERYGQVKNPYRADRVTGGSSSGSAAAVAARIVPASFGGDTIGSIRVPASLSGVIGFKPTTGRWPRDGVAPVSHTLDTTGLLARTVEDAILIDQVVTNRALAPPSEQSDLRGVRFAYAPGHYLTPIEAETEALFRDALERLEDAGAEVVEIDLGKDFAEIADRLTWNIFFHETRSAVSEFLRRNHVSASFDDVYYDLKPQLKAVWGEFVVPSGRGFVSPEAYDVALNVDRPEIQRRFGDVFTSGAFDALLFPTTPTTAPSIEHQWTFSIAGREVSDLILAKNTIPTSAAGLPGISLPLGLSNDGLPIGIELDGAHGQDPALLDLARRVQAILGTMTAPHGSRVVAR